GAGAAERTGSLDPASTADEVEVASGEAPGMVIDGVEADNGAAVPLSDGSSGRRHLPEEFWAQTTSGLVKETCRITSRLPKSDQNCTRSWKLCACRKLPPILPGSCGMVMPLSFNPPH